MPYIFDYMRTAMRVVVLIAVFAVGCSSSSYAASPTLIASLLTTWWSLNGQCRGGVSGDARAKACERRSEIDAQLERAGCSYHSGDRWVCKSYTPKCTYSAQSETTVCK
jgi:hypothetical protein